MRTRFLNIDYFSVEPPPSSPTQTLTFLNLPVPLLPSTLPLASERDLPGFDSLSAIDVSLQLDRLDIESALSKFLSDVIPQFIDVGGGEGCGNGSVEKEGELSPGVKESLDCCSTLKTAATEDQLPKINRENFINGKGTQGIAVFQLETPELVNCLENSYLLEEEAVGIFSEVLEIENSEDAPKLGFLANYTLEAQEAVTSFGDTSIQYLIEPKAVFWEGDANVASPSDFPCTKFPLLEEEEISLEVMTSTTMKYELVKLLDKVEPVNLSQNDDFSFDTKEILNLLEKDLSEFPSHRCLFKECLEWDSVIGASFLEMDFVSIVDRPYLRGSSPCQGPSDRSYFSSISPVVLEDFQILDMGTALFCEVFSLQEVHEPDFCNEMLQEKVKFKNFEELVISRELALADEMFKSLPVPVLPDSVLGTLYAIVAAALIDMKPQPPLASDGIYLNWHLLEEESCSSAIYSFYHNMLAELNRSFDFDLNTSNYGKVILDFILLDHTPSRPKFEEGSGPLDMLSDGVSLLREGLTEAASRTSTATEYQKPASQTLVSEYDSKRASSFFKSMSPFHDLEFFLNPSKDRAEENSVPPGKIPGEMNNTHAVKIPGDLACKVSTSSPGEGNASCEPPVAGSGHIELGLVSFPESVIIVNTQNSSEVMLVSRRSTYQKILAMEKEGIQVIERDTTLPVDIIISAAVCLVWYTRNNIGRKSSGFNEASSVLPCYIENIAANILTNLSFAFGACILIFEGESGFLASVMESSDGLYAAAASLGIGLQLFCSFSPELTDEIILKSIAQETRIIRGLYTKLPESETLAESFLTNFPSVNPLSAHAILSTEGRLSDFFESSHECRISVVKKYQVPDESVSLFSALCQFGEREDSRSIMTDCSSSVSSGPDSKHCHSKLDSGGKTCEYKKHPDKGDVPVEDLLHFQPSELCNNSSSKLPGFMNLYDLSTFKDQEIPNKFKESKFKESNSCLDHFVGKKKGMDESITTCPSRVGNQFDSWITKGVFSSDVTEHQTLASDDDFLHWYAGAHTTDTFDWADTKNSDIVHKETKGESMNLTNPSIANPLEFSFSLPGLENDAKGGSNHASRFSFDRHNYPTIPTVAESDSTSLIHSPGNPQKQSLQEETDCFLSTELVNDKMPTDDWEKLCKGFSHRRSMENLQGMPVQANRGRYNGTPLRNAIHMPHLQKGSPWTIEFLNRIREKSKLWQQPLPSSASPCFSNTRTKSNTTKRRSPSILEFFKYQGGSTVRKTPEEKRQKRSAQSFGSFRNGKVSASLVPSWTPVDKRARRKLSFVTNESESQTKLVWGDKAREIHNH
ncbi:protein SHORTAGE IN CHIASMATA 1 [Rhodamnia argentea]|uniref:Protein SHORTAGE IN CHIASMATA 1 n=1 Tax=Rhodamnia argentea TaxID=178133 RepID=A0A8B8PFM8_9MYRT|nr:protein SHORTAGE IN CHIASMATA 1 [Rhodamnia argentea]XP_048138951.1 protein SHORTAGE IN CHIASMATA 1 [Rhodamnia argentea]